MEPLKVELSPFNRLHIVRAEIEDREEELSKLESKMREVLYEVERLTYLGSIDPCLSEGIIPDGYNDYQKMDERRQALHRAITALKASLKVIETETGGASSAQGGGEPSKTPSLKELQAQRSPNKRSRFDSF